MPNCTVIFMTVLCELTLSNAGIQGLRRIYKSKRRLLRETISRARDDVGVRKWILFDATIFYNYNTRFCVLCDNHVDLNSREKLRKYNRIKY